jgi:anaerobic selenocysteine-containing dehydrogenase
MLMQYAQSGGSRLERAGYTPSPALGEELFQKVKDTPGDILMAVQDVENNLADGIAHEDGKVRLHIPRLDDWMAEINPAAEIEKLENTGYPLVLAAGERTDFNATSRMRNKEWIGDRQPCTLKMHPEDAKELGLDTGMKALVETERGSLEIEIQVSESPSPCRGMVFMPHGFGLEHCGQVRGVNVNYLTSSRHRDRFAGTPLHKSVPCRVSPL